jgi:N-acetylmuramoyl-L-alanine amidase
MTGCHPLSAFLPVFVALALALTALPDSALAGGLPSPLSDSPNGPLHVMVDPGHGGSDTGASRGDIKESEIALKVSLKLVELLKQDPRFKVSMTRTTDHKVALAKRVQMAENANADLFLSIHLNSSPEPRVHGTEIYFQNQLPADEEALYLVSREHVEDDGQNIDEKDGDSLKALDSVKSEPISMRTDLKRILEDLHRNHRIVVSSELGKTLLENLVSKSANPHSANRSIRQAPFHVVSYITIPSVLVELGFITHPQEGPQLAKTERQTELARSLYDGLVKFKETVDNQARQTLKLQALASPK